MLYYNKLFEQQSFMSHINNSDQGLWEGGSAGTSVRGTESQEGACESLKGPNSLSQRRFIFYFLGRIQLFLVYLEKKITSCFFGPQILNFEISLSLSPGPQSNLVPPCKISLGVPDNDTTCITDFINQLFLFAKVHIRWDKIIFHDVHFSWNI